ncbi:MAG: hypothetical protein RIQ61_1452 [Bacteroidota bacterium]
MSLLVSFYLMPILIKVADKFKLYDVPNERKIHSAFISSLGGVGIYFSVMIGLFVSRLLEPDQHFDSSFYFILLGMIVIFINGLGDDLFGYTAKQKFFIQFAICFAFIDSKGAIQIYFEELFNSYLLSRVFLSIGLVAVINSVNLLDGIDGLAASIGIFITFVFFVLNVLHGNYPLTILSVSLLGALGGFLYFNFNPAKIFMGDSGSLLLGFIIALLAISTPYRNYSISIYYTKLHVISLILSVLAFPIFEVVRLFFTRIMSGKSPFIGDRNHLHHILVDKGFNQRGAVLVLLLINFLFVVSAMTVFQLPIVLLLTLEFLGYLAFVFLLKRSSVLSSSSGMLTKIRDKD